MECGIVGLPGTGKTSLFAALTGVKAVPAGGAAKPNIGVTEIPDPRLAMLAECVQPRKITHATITFVDIAGIDSGGGAARSGPVLASVRQVEALCEVIRCFDTAGEPPDPIRDITVLQDELILADLATVESSLDKAARAARGADAEAVWRGWQTRRHRPPAADAPGAQWFRTRACRRLPRGSKCPALPATRPTCRARTVPRTPR